MTEAILNRAQQLYGEAREIVAEEVKLRQRSSRHIVRLASILKDLYETFQQREDPREGLVLVRRGKDSPTSARLCSNFFARSIWVSAQDGISFR